MSHTCHATGCDSSRSLTPEPERDLVASLLKALAWCGGSSDFNEGGQAHEGWLRICEPAIRRAERSLINAQALEKAVRELRRAVSDELIRGRTVKPKSVDEAIVQLFLLVDMTEDEERSFRDRHALPTSAKAALRQAGETPR